MRRRRRNPSKQPSWLKALDYGLHVESNAVTLTLEYVKEYLGEELATAMKRRQERVAIDLHDLIGDVGNALSEARRLRI